MEAGNQNVPESIYHLAHGRSIMAAVDFRGHEHLLFFLERVDPSEPQMCRFCEESMSELMFRCVKDDCGYVLHLSCGPLPVAIPYRHGGHELTLTLKDTFLDGVNWDDCWCDICEKQRDPRKCVYRSEDPPFTATIDCLLRQIVGALQGDHGEVELRSVRGHLHGVVTAQGSPEEESEEVIVGRKIQNNAADLENNVDISSHGEEFIVFDDTSTIDWMPWEGEEEFIEHALAEVQERLFRADIESIPYRYSDPAFEQFEEVSMTREGGCSSWMVARWMEEEPHFVRVGDNLVVPEVAPLYRQLVDKHGDFTTDSPLSPICKGGILTMLLTLIRETVGLQIREVTDDLLCLLQLLLEFINENFGFDLQFALDNLEQLARACYALKFVKVRDNITADLTQQIEQLEREIPEDKPKIEALKQQYKRAKESAFVKQCLAEASALEWKNAGEFLGMD